MLSVRSDSAKKNKKKNAFTHPEKSVCYAKNYYFYLLEEQASLPAHGEAFASLEAASRNSAIESLLSYPW